MKYQAVIFDLDGTLLNTLEDLADSVNFALKQFGYPIRTIAEVRAFVGNGVQKLIERAVPEQTTMEKTLACLEVFRNYYAKNMRNKTCLYEGIKELLQELNERKIKMAIVSNKFDAAVKELKKELFSEYIQVAIGESIIVPKKPNPSGVFAALEELGVKKENALYVGDSEVDIMTAKNAGVISVGVTWGFRDCTVLENSKANHIIHTPQRLLDIIDFSI